MANEIQHFDVLVDIEFSTYDPDTESTDVQYRYYSRNAERVVGGHTYVPRILEISGLEGQYLDRSVQSFSNLSITFDDIPDWGETDGPFKALTAINDWGYQKIRVYILNVATGDADEVFWGYTKRSVKIDDFEKKFTLSASFLWDSTKIKIPSKTFQHTCPYALGGSPEVISGAPVGPCSYPTTSTNGGGGDPGYCDKGTDTPDGCIAHGMMHAYGGFTKIAPILHKERNNFVAREDIRKSGLPLLFGLGTLIVRPEVIHARIVDSKLYVTFVVSVTNPGLPFASDALTLAGTKMFSHRKAEAVEWLPGLDVQPPPANTTRFPDGSGHSRLAMGCGIFGLSEAELDDYKGDGGDIKLHALKLRIDGGRKLRRLDDQSDNPVYILEDILRDDIVGLGLAESEIDSAAVVDAADYASTRFPSRVEIDTQTPLLEFVQDALASFHGYITWNNSKMQIRCKRDDEVHSKTFGTGGRKLISMGEVKPIEQDDSDLINQYTVSGRSQFRKKYAFTYIDHQAQKKAGGGQVLPNADDRFLFGVAEPYAMLVSGAILLREEQNQNYFVDIETPLLEGHDVLPGEIIQILSPSIIANPGNNTLWRVIGKQYKIGDEPTVSMKCQVYKQIVYAYNAQAINGDIIRSGEDTTYFTAPPNVILDDPAHQPTLAVIDSAPGDDDTKLLTIQCKWKNPEVDPADVMEQEEEGVTVSGPPLSGVQLAWRYTHEPVRNLRYPVKVAYPEEEALLRDIEFHKDFDIEVWFIALGSNNSHGQVGYVVDPTQTTGLDQDVDDTETSFDIILGEGWAPFIGEQCKCENEIMEVTGIAGSTITVLRAQVGTLASAHEQGTEIGPVMVSHPTAVLDLNAPRYTYPVVPNVRAKTRRDGTRIIWDDIKLKNKEDYVVVWSANTAQLATPNPAWYLADPETPPSEIMLKETRHTALKIPFEEIDSEKTRLGLTGRDIVVRVYARNRKNYSSALSAIAGAAHTHGPTAPPADPILADVSFVDNDPTSDKIDAYFKVYATVDRIGTYDSTGAQAGGIRLAKRKKSDGTWKPAHTFFEQSENPATDAFVIVHKQLRRGSEWRMERAVTKNDAGRAKSNDVTIPFRAGDNTDDLAGIVDLQITFLTDKGSRKTVATVEWTNPDPAPSLRVIKLWTKEGADVDYHVEDKERLLDDESFQTPGAKTIDLMCQHNKDDMVWYYVELVGTDGDRIMTSAINAVALGDDGGDLPIRSDGSGPGYPDAVWVTRNTVLGDPAHGNVAFGYRVFMDGGAGDNVFGSPDPGYGPVRRMSIALQPRNAANSADVGERVVLSANAFEDKGSLAALQEITGKLELAQRYRIMELRYFNSSDELVRLAGVVIDIVGGSQSYAFNATTLTGVSIAYSAATTDTRHGLVTVTFTQPAIPVLLKRVVIEVSYNAGSTWAKAAAENILDDAPYFSITGGPARVFQKRIQHKKAQNQFRVRAIIVPYGSDYESTYITSPNLVIAQTSNETILDDGYVTGTNPSTAAAGPVFKQATIGNGGLFASFEKPVDSRPTFEHYEFQFSDSNSNTGDGLPGGGTAARDWLDCDDGLVAVTSAAANTDHGVAATTLASATFVSKTNRFSESHLRRRDLATTFKSNADDGNLTLYVKCRLVDRTDAGAFRYGAWSAWGTVVKKATQDRDTDTPSRNHAAGTGNGFEGWGCSNSASQFPSAAGNHGTTATLGLNFYAVPQNNDEELTIRPFLTVLGVPGTQRYITSPAGYIQESGNQYDTGNRGIYWHKNVPAIAVFGNAGRTDYRTAAGLIQPSINCRITGNVRIGETYWAVFAVAVEDATLLSSISGIYAKLIDRSTGGARFTSPSMTWTFDTSKSFKLIAIKVNTATSFSGNAWFQFTFPTWTQSATRILYITNGIWRRGPTPPRVWVPGKYEANLDPVTGVTFSSFGLNLTSVDMQGGWSTDGITDYGELKL